MLQCSLALLFKMVLSSQNPYHTFILQNLEPLVHINFLQEESKPGKNTKLQF